MNQVPAVILAGGRSSRMGGGDKCLTPFAGRPLLSHVMERIGPQVSPILINSNSDPALFADFGLAIRPDTVPGRLGPLAGLLTGLMWAKEISATHLLTVPCDTPFLPEDLASRLNGELRHAKADIAMACDRQQSHPVIALWPVNLIPLLARELANGARSVRHWSAQFRICHAEFAEVQLINLNHRAELMRAESRDSGELGIILGSRPSANA